MKPTGSRPLDLLNDSEPAAPAVQATEARCRDLEESLHGAAGEPTLEAGPQAGKHAAALEAARGDLAAAHGQALEAARGDLAAAHERAEQLAAELAAVKGYARALGAELAAARVVGGAGARAASAHTVVDTGSQCMGCMHKQYLQT